MTINNDTLKHSSIVFCIMLLVYLASMPLTIALEDDGLFVLSNFEFGISHPPGYPLHTLIGHGFTKIPLGSIAARVHAVSALFGALTCAIIFLITLRLLACRAMSYLAALTYGLSLIFWSQSIISEVYTLNTFLFYCLFYLCLLLSDDDVATSKNDRPNRGLSAPGWLLGFIAFGYGLSLTNHWPLIILSTPALIILLWKNYQFILDRLGVCIALVIIGLSPYLWMYIHSQTDPTISFYGPMESLSNLWFYISRQGYSSVDNSLSADFSDKWNYLGFFLSQSSRQFGTLGFILVLIGLWAQFKIIKLRVSLSLVFALLGNSVLLILLLGFDYQLIYQSAFRVYPIVAYGVMSIWLALGAHWLINYLSQFRLFSSTSNTSLRWIFTVSLVSLVFILNLPENYRRDYVWGENYARFILESVDKNAIIFGTDDVVIGTLGYMNRVNKVRPDISIYNRYGLLFNNRISSPFRDSAEEAKQKVSVFIKNSIRPIYFLNNLDSGFGATNFLFYQRVNNSLPEGTQQLSISKDNLNFLIALVNEPESADVWTRNHRIVLLESIVPQISQFLSEQNNGPLSDTLRSVLAKSTIHFNTKLARLKWLLEKEEQDHSIEINRSIVELEILLDNALTKSGKAKFYLKKALWLHRNDKLDAAIEAHQSSIDLWFHPKNESINIVLNLYQQQGRANDFNRLIDRINATKLNQREEPYL